MEQKRTDLAREPAGGREAFDVSVTIVSYNNKRDIVACLESLLSHERQSGLRLQLFVVNNSQTENCKDLEERFPVTVLQMESNKGFGGGHNSAIPHLRSRYHVVLNPDILFRMPVFEKLVKYLNENSGVGALAPLIVDADGNLQGVYRRELTIGDLICRYLPHPFCETARCKKKRFFHEMRDVNKQSPFACEFIQGSFLVFPTEVFKNLGGFDERFFMYAEDADLCKRIRKMGKAVKCLPDCKVVHKWEKASHRSLKLLMIHFSSLVKYFCKRKFTNGGGTCLDRPVPFAPSTSCISFGFPRTAWRFA